MKKIFVSAMLALVMLVSGCEQQPPPDTQADEKPAPVTQDVKVKPQDPPPSKPAETAGRETPPAPKEKVSSNMQTMSVKVYYPDDSGTRLVEVERRINVENDSDKYSAAVDVLFEAPHEDNLTTIFPKNASIRSVKVKDGLATVDLDSKMLKTMVGGSTGEEFLVGSIVDTLTNFPEVTHVKFLVDGQEVETLKGHMDLSAPIERMSGLLK